MNHQLKTWVAVRERLDEEGFDLVLRPASVRLVPERLKASASLAIIQRERPSGLRFGLQIASFEWSVGPGALAERLRGVAEAAESSGFESIWVMDHVRQIPQISRGPIRDLRVVIEIASDLRLSLTTSTHCFARFLDVLCHGCVTTRRRRRLSYLAQRVET
ncbi:MAG: hypothetical protein ABJD24_04450 [Acidimicrobiales bacterium]